MASRHGFGDAKLVMFPIAPGHSHLPQSNIPTVCFLSPVARTSYYCILPNDHLRRLFPPKESVRATGCVTLTQCLISPSKVAARNCQQAGRRF